MAQSDGSEPGSQEARSPRGGRDLPLAVGSAVLFAVLFLVSAFVNAWVLLAFVSLAMMIAVLEVDAALRSTAARPPTALVLVAGPATLVAAYVEGSRGQLAATTAMVLGVVFWALAHRADDVPLRSAGSGLLIALWIPFLASFLALLLRRPDGQWYVILTIALTAMSDIFAYAVGYRYGRHKLAPAVSPGKTWEGALGGVAGTMIVAAVIGPLMVDRLAVGVAVALGALVASVAIVGDLAESAVKRSLGVKDLGRLLPGHGGMMDRVDAMLFTLPVTHLVLLAGRL